MQVNICDGIEKLTDAVLEKNYAYILKLAENKITTEVQVDFRYIEWFDLWSLIQLLFILQGKEVKNKKRSILLLSPDAITTSGEQRLQDQRNIKATLKFLLDTEFLNRAEDLGVKIFLQKKMNVNSVESIDLIEIKQIAGEALNTRNASDSSRPLIPITAISKLKLQTVRNQLFTMADRIFKEYQHEAIVQEAGIGDCLLSELIYNVKAHANDSGYIALRAGLSLSRLKEKNTHDYENRKNARKRHPLEDWRTYFKKYPDDSYFELLIADKGKGISQTITEDKEIDKKIDKKINKLPDSIEKEHKLLEYALQPYSSRLSIQERKKRNLTDFTGLGAVKFIIEEYLGALLIRERGGRHIFGTCTRPTGNCYDSVSVRDNSNKKYTKRTLAQIPGVSVTAIIPMKRGLHKTHSTPPIVASADCDDVKTEAFDSIAYYRIRPVKNTIFNSVLDNKIGIRWKTVANHITKLGDKKDIVLLDINSSTIDKNDLWSGLVTVYKACQERKKALILCGINQRLSFRLEDYILLDKKRISNNKEWLLLAFGDNLSVYCLGDFEKNQEHKIILSRKIIDSFVEGSNVASNTLKLLNDANYIETKVETWRISQAKFKTTLYILREKLNKIYADTLKKEIENSPAYLSNKPSQLVDGNIVTDYLCIHSISQRRNIFTDLSRLICLLSNSFEVDFVLSVGITSKSLAKDLAQHLYDRQLLKRLEKLTTEEITNNKKEDQAEHFGFYVYHDYFHFDYGESARNVIKKDSKVLLVVDGIRSGANCREAIKHIRNSEAEIIGIIALFDLSYEGLPRVIDDVPLQCAIEMLIRNAKSNEKAEYYVSPDTGTLQPLSNKHSYENWHVILTKQQAYRYIEAYGLIIKGHTTFFDQHFAITISLPHLLSSSTAMNIELLHNLQNIIKKNKIDCIIYPDDSSISTLVDRLIKIPYVSKNTKTVMCRHSKCPNSESGYELDIIGNKILSNAKNIFILEDETYTGSSIKNILRICLSHQDANPKKLIIFSVIDSMKSLEKKNLISLMEGYKNNRRKITIKFMSFMHFSLFSYWSKSECPLCQRYDQLDGILKSNPLYMEEDYALRRTEVLEPVPTEQDPQARKKLNHYSSLINYSRPFMEESVSISTSEGQIILFEEAYVEGDIGWLVSLVHPSHPKQTSIGLLLEIIGILSRDFSLLHQSKVKDKFLKYVRLQVFGKYFEGKHLARLMELLSNWQLNCLIYVWFDLWLTLFEEDEISFYESYPGAYILIRSVTNRQEHPLKNEMLNVFNNKVGKLLDESRCSLDFKLKRKALLAAGLRTSVYRYTQEYRHIAPLVAEITRVVAYYPLEKSAHWILWKGLNSFALCEKGEITKKYVFVLQMMSQLFIASSSLALVDPIFIEVTEHPGFTKLQDVYENLKDECKKRVEIGSQYKIIRNYANELKNILYEDKSPNGFNVKLQKYLEAYKCSLSDIIDKISASLGEQDVAFNNDIELSAFNVVMDNSCLVHSFEEISKNLADAKKRYFTKQCQLTFPTERFPVNICITCDSEKIFFEIENKATEKDCEEVDNKTEHGITQIEVNLRRLGHNYNIESIKEGEKSRIIQKIEIWRVN